MSSVLAVDIGRTGCRAALWRAAAREPDATAAGDGSLGLGASDGARVAEAAILAVVKPLLATRRVAVVDAVGVGIPGAIGAPEAARQLAAHLAASIPARRVAVTSDAISSHAGALAGLPGVVLAAGTGAVTIAIGEDRQLHRIDGWGPWLGDEGSGAWLGRAGLQAVARAGDGRGPATALAAVARQQFGSIERLAAKLGHDPNPARSLAAFAPAVAAAARKGDAVAARLIEAAAAALAEAVLAGARSLHASGTVAVAIVGGLVQVGPVLLDPLRAALDRSGVDLRLQPAAGTSLDGARRLAVAEHGVHDPWVVRARGAMATANQHDHEAGQ